MKQIFGYIREFLEEVNIKVLGVVSLFTGLFIFINYYFRVDDRVSDLHFHERFIYRYIIFLLAFAFPYLLYRLIADRKYSAHPLFLLLLFLSPAIFALKSSLNFPIHFTNDYTWNNYWNHVFYWPFLLVLLMCILFVIWKITERGRSFYGMTGKQMNWRPYFMMLLIMLPLVALASTQPDFLAMYPKLKVITRVFYAADITWWHKLIFELSYGSDFIGIELFFRGFLVLAFIKWAGKDAILPMACFYCTIHFGKPLGECISSFFGGAILGIISYHTRSIWGGLMVHLGIAWLMELGGYIGNAINR